MEDWHAPLWVRFRVSPLPVVTRLVSPGVQNRSDLPLSSLSIGPTRLSDSCPPQSHDCKTVPPPPDTFCWGPTPPKRVWARTCHDRHSQAREPTVPLFDSRVVSYFRSGRSPSVWCPSVLLGPGPRARPSSVTCRGGGVSVGGEYWGLSRARHHPCYQPGQTSTP